MKAGRHGSNQIVCVFGRKGSGKSTLLGRLVERFAAKNPKLPIVVFDFLGDQEMPSELKFRRIPFRDLPDELEEEEAPRVILDLYGLDRATFLRVFEKTTRVVLFEGRPLLVVIDEMDFPRQVSASQIPPDLAELVSYGRHAGVSLYAAARRPQDVPKLLISQSDLIFCGQQVGARELQVLKEYGFEPDSLRNLKVGEFSVIDFASGDVTPKTLKVKPF